MLNCFQYKFKVQVRRVLMHLSSKSCLTFWEMLKSAICRARSNAKGAGVYKIRRSYFSVAAIVCGLRSFRWVTTKKGSCTCVVDGCQSKRKNVVGRRRSFLSSLWIFLRTYSLGWLQFVKKIKHLRYCKFIQRCTTLVCLLNNRTYVRSCSGRFFPYVRSY